MKVVLFYGGFGTRIRDYVENIPKPMISATSRSFGISMDTRK